jgi:hypothetical protein
MVKMMFKKKKKNDIGLITLIGLVVTGVGAVAPFVISGKRSFGLADKIKKYFNSFYERLRGVGKMSSKDERQYEHIKESSLNKGTGIKKAKEIAARTVNKRKRKEGRPENKTTQGTGNPNKSLEERSRQELYNKAKALNIEGRSKMKKSDLINAIRNH